MRFILTVFVLTFLLNGFAFAQKESLQDIARQANNYQSLRVQEKLFLHIDKSVYLATEKIWFKVYSVDGSLHRPMELSKVAYVELINSENKSVLKAKVSMNEGSGESSFTLPVSLNSGSYNLRAYTNWMKNFSSDYFFNKQITIINTSKKLGLETTQTANELEVQFFPEGGNLVQEVENKVAFKVNKKGRNGVDFYGYLLNQDKDTVLKFRPHKFGIGTFTFIPLKTESYKVVIATLDGKTISKELPEIFLSGYVLRLTKETEKQIEFTVSTKNIPETEALTYYYLIAHTRGITKVAEANILRNGKATFLIEKNKLGEGITHFTLFSPDKKPLCERLYFKTLETKLEIEVQNEKESFASREKVGFNIVSKTESGKALPSDLSLSVFLLDSLEDSDPLTIQSYLWLSSDLKGSIESPTYYFKNKDEETRIALDNLMLTHGWSRFKWENVFSDEKPFFEYVPEKDGLLVYGKLTDKRTNLPAPNITAYLSIPGKKVELYGAKSNKNGQLIFSVRELYGSNEVVLQTNFEKDSVYSIQLYDSFSENLSKGILQTPQLNESMKETILLRSINSQILTNYWKKETNKFKTIRKDSLPFYVRADKTYLLDAFNRFPTIEEVMREYVPEVMVRKKKGEFHFYVLDNPHDLIFDNDPLILLDNVPVFDTDKIMTFDPLKIRKLEVMSRRYFNGPINSEGIVSYTTYGGDLAGFELDPRSLFIEYDGIALQQEFFSPSYESNEQMKSRIPDFRNLLYWKPSLKTDAKGQEKVSFYTSDMEGKYGMLVQGISKDGRAGAKFVTFEVRKNLN